MSRQCVHHVALPRVLRGIPRHQKRVSHRLLVCKQQVKRATFRDCGRRCVYCGSRLGIESATLDHVIPLSRGGSHNPGNLVSACQPCNQLKGSLLPTEFFARYPVAGENFVRHARAVHRQLKRGAKRAVSLFYAEAA